MSSNRIADIHVNLSANTANYKRDMDRARKITKRSTGKMMLGFRGMERGIGGAFSAVGRLRGGLFALAGAGGLTLLVKRSIATADAIGKVADKVGVSVEALQQLRFAGEQAAGVVGGTMDMALQRFSRRVGEAANGGGELTGTLKQYGIDVKNADGSTRSLVNIMYDLADAIKGAGSSQEKLRISFKAFDSEGAALVNLFGQGREGLKRYADEANRLGIVLSNSAVRAAERANDQFGRMQQIIGVNLTRTMISFAPLVIRLGSAFSEAAPKILAFMNRLLPDFLRGSNSLRGELASVQTRLQGLVESYKAAKAGGSDTIWLIKNGARARQLAARVKELRTQIDAASKSEAVVKGGLKIGVNKSDGSRKVVDSITRRANAIKFETTLIGKSRAEKAKLQALEGAMITARASGVKLTETHLSQLQIQADRVGVLTGTLDGLEKAQQRNKQMAADFGTAFVSALDRAEQEGTKFKGFLRGLAIDMARIFTTRQLENGINDLITGGTLNKAFGSIGKLFSGGGASQPVGTARFAHGGSFMVGGSGGTDSQTVGFKASPNERVTIETPAQQRRDSGGTYYIDARGADQAGLARLESMITALHGSIEHRAVAAVVDAKARNPRLLGAGA